MSLISIETIVRGMGRRDAVVMTEREAEEFIMRLLAANGPMTTKEIEEAASVDGRRCPDQTVLFLAKMRARSLLVGEVSLEKGGWLWSVG